MRCVWEWSAKEIETILFVDKQIFVLFAMEAVKRKDENAPKQPHQKKVKTLEDFKPLPKPRNLAVCSFCLK